MEDFFSIKRILSKRNILLILSVMLLFGTVLIQNILDKEIKIIDKNKEITIHTISSNAERALKKGDIQLSEYDRLNIGRDTKLVDGMTIEVYRAFPLNINVDGKELEVLTAFNQVKDIIDQYDIKLGEKDRVEPELSKEIKPNDTINVIRVKEEVEKETQEIPYRSVIKYNDEMDYKDQKKVQEGKMGKREVEYKIIYENGEEVAKELLSENVLIAPIDEVIEKGSEKYLVASRGQVIRYKGVINMSSTAYDLSYQSTGKYPDHPEYGITYSGTRARPGVVAVDPRVIPLGTRLYVEGLNGSKDYGYAVAEDTGSAIKGNKIDLFMEDHSEAMRYGRRNVKVYILE